MIEVRRDYRESAGQILVIVPSVQTNSDYSGVNRYYGIDECTNLQPDVLTLFANAST
jgi:hypothetical protein